MAQVEEIEDQLREKHHDKYSPEQLRSWAHMYIMKKHDSLEDPPDKPFWKGTSSKNKSASGGVTQVVVFTGTLTATRYFDILEAALIPFFFESLS